MSKYSPLRDFLSQCEDDLIELSFKEIEDILGSSLPDSAREHRGWWGNDRSHTQARNGWLAAGWEVSHVDLQKEIVVFRRKNLESKQTHKTSEMTWKEFEELARKVMSKYFGVELKEKYVEGHPKTFDLVSDDGSVVGDAKYLTMVRGKRIPPAKFMEISGHVWMLEKINAKRKFLVFGNDIRVPKEWLKRYGKFLKDIEFFFIDAEGNVIRLK